MNLQYLITQFFKKTLLAKEMAWELNKSWKTEETADLSQDS
jgi:hypothetical protein